MKIIISKQDYNKHKDFWANTAKKRGWYQEPFTDEKALLRDSNLGIWVDEKGEIQDSVSYKGIKKECGAD